MPPAKVFTPTSTLPAEELFAWGTPKEMSPLEALMWRAEADPSLRSHMTAVEILDCLPDWDRLVAAHDWGTRVARRFRERVIEPPLGLGPPVWALDENFDLAYHLRRVSLPAPGSFRALLDLAQGVAMAPLDAVRPQWEAVLVEGLEGGRAAYILKINHALTDGIGAIQLLERLHSRQREHTYGKLQPAPPTPGATTPAGVLVGQVAERLRAAPGDAGRTAMFALSLTARALRHPRGTLGDAVCYARSLQRVLSPPGVAPSPLLSGRSMSWRFVTHEVPLAELRAAAKAVGGSVNDAYLAALLGAFRLYHERRGAPVELMPVAIPISTRADDDGLGGNRIAAARFAAPVSEADPRRRMRLVRECVSAARAEPAIDAVSIVAPLVSRLPTPLLTRVSRASTNTNDLQASNVPGIAHVAYMAGARVTHLYPFGPLPGCAAMITLVSHAGTCCIGANLDGAAVTDTKLFGRCLAEGFDEVLELGAAKTRHEETT
jgi:diacylglycerol O-acyltransferase / wax synthase